MGKFVQKTYSDIPYTELKNPPSPSSKSRRWSVSSFLGLHSDSKYMIAYFLLWFCVVNILIYYPQ